MEFNADGSLKVVKKKIPDHINLFLHISELPFPVGKKLLVQSLRGDVNARTKKLRFDKLIYFGTFGGYTEEELNLFIDFLQQQVYLAIERQKGIYSVLVLSKKGLAELDERKETFEINDIIQKGKIQAVTHMLQETHYTPEEITEQDRKLFETLDFFLGRFTDEQKKAIICQKNKQVCIAGAGSGKTAVLTNKIAYLIQFKGVDPEKILAITFTRKAKQEMDSRLASLIPGKNVRIETFNSFAEKELLKHGTLLYGKQKRMASYQEFNQLVIKGIQELGYSLDTFLNHYFTPREQNGKEQNQLFFSFLYDFRAILEAFIEEKGNIDVFETKISGAKLTEKITARKLVQLADYVYKELQERGLRTFTDQLIDLNALYDLHEELKPNYDWILVDEYQDVSKEQEKLIEHLKPKNLFVVGDPRQSIYSWRGASPETIYSFIDDSTAVIELTTNFRSRKKIVSFANAIIAQSNRGKNSFAPLHSNSQQEGIVELTKYSSEEEEARAIIEHVQTLATPLNEVFILSRTNKGLERFQKLCQEKNIQYLLRTDEKKGQQLEPDENQLTLSTVHGIKGLEAEFVYLPSVDFTNYPSSTKDHRFVDLLANPKNYDVFEEERRLLYVAVTRAKAELHVSYIKGLSPFLSQDVLALLSNQTPQEKHRAKVSRGINKAPLDTDRVEQQRKALKRWRYLQAQEHHVPAYVIFNDRTLESILEAQPLSVEELLDVYGFGKAKVEKFGEEIISLLFRG